MLPIRALTWLALTLAVGLGFPHQSFAQEAEPDAAVTAVAESETETEAAAETPAKGWAAMSVEEKLDALQGAALVVDEDTGAVSSGVYSDTDVLWTCLAAFLVFFMQAGFAMVEAGFTRAKNACNIMMKNLMDFSIGTLAFWMAGFGLMFGVSSGFVGTTSSFPLRTRA